MDMWSGMLQPPAPPYLWIQCMDRQVLPGLALMVDLWSVTSGL